MPSVLPDYRAHDAETARLLGLRGTLNSLSALHQKLVAEIVLLRLFSLFENLITSVSLKLTSGASYVDRTVPMLLARARSSQSAMVLLKTHGRAKPINQLRWSKGSEIKNNLRHVMDQNDNLMTVVDRNAGFIDELRRVRNRIAHNNAQSRKNYRDVVRRHYGAYMNNVTPGMLLLTQRLQPSLLEQYIRREGILVRDIVKA